LDGRVRDRDHAKVYIADDNLAVVGSGNLTVNGLRQNVEGMALVPSERVTYWVEQFEQHWHDPQTVDLTQALLDALLAWLTLHPPYHVYLKTIAALIGEDDTPPPRPDYKMPVQYQQVVIERLLRQLEDWRGAMLVASTGLGKTVIATHTAYRLLLARKILNVIVLAPLQVLPNWQESMASGGIACETFTRDLLDQPLRRRGDKLSRLVAALERADERYIIFVDESHHFKNRLRAKDGRTRHSFDRLQAAVGRGAMVVLLTATPLAKGVEDVNNQLYLLPHTAERRYVTAIGQHVIPGTRDDELDLNAWKVGDHEAFFSDFINLPVTTVISTSQVARNFAERTPEGDMIRFGSEKRWLPSVAIKKVRVPVPVEAGMSAALAGDAFKHKLKRFQSRGAWQISESTIHNQAIVAWTSSPAALREIVSNTLDGTYDEKWLCPLDKQWTLLEPIHGQLDALPAERDEKFLALCHILAEAQQTGQKAIIFTERHSTAHYLEQQLAQRLPGLRVASVVAQQDGKYRLKDFNRDVQELIIGFAPEANKDIAESRDYEPYDAFISTDAYSTGVNLQDASIVINYDLAWTPDT
ncbi:MAG: DEAD/DEAH box helicase family protein, partial [Anaerolineales bacterium]|nr:DEAD/DEAH box helicase family protein [Anaerolineales bacterium]